MNRRQKPFQRINVIFLGIFALAMLIIVRLFWLQVIQHSYYEAIAQAEQQGYTTLPSRRGEIIIQDYHSGEGYKLATNTTLNMIYADPTLVDAPDLVAETLAPFLFDLEIEQEIDDQRFEEEYEIIMMIENEELRNEAIEKVDHKDEEELFKFFQENLEETLAQRTKDFILYTTDLDVETQDSILALNLSGVEITENGNLYFYLDEMSDKNKVASELAEVFNIKASALEQTLLGLNRYVILLHKLEPEISDQIEEILDNDRLTEEPQFLGIRLTEEYFRFYPEQELAAQILGYVNSAGSGQYGVEGTFDEVLQGQDGIFTSQIDAYGNQITVGESVIEDAVDGADVMLTIDRAIQLQVEKALSAGVEAYNADSGQVIVLNPSTGEVLAMAQYPTFNPNVYGEVFNLVEFEVTEDKKEFLYITGEDTEDPKYWYYKQVDPDVRIELFPSEDEPGVYYAYENDVGPEVYKNKMIQEIYEPGSIFKPIAMSSALDSGEVTPNTTFVDSGPLDVDYNVNTGEYDFTIDNFDGQHHGVQTMTQVLEKSNNIGMAFVAQQLGSALYYSYLKAFGFLQRTDMGLNDEVIANLEYYDNWTESELVTKAFGQGIAVTAIQLAQAYTALANDGTMMRPYLVKEIQYADGTVENFEPEIIRQVISDDAASSITAMMTATAESYMSLKLDKHYFAGKSGTAQTYKWGRALSGPGTTIASFVGYGPVEDPQFLVVVKIDRPRTVEWGAATAGPVFNEIASFLFDYYNVPPDKI
ncbi:MAG: stage V sporulation protein D (sporulation-specific penicillin-binding protein) [Oceanicoccus sp.]|jgi:stage V sporulation protein D (sporulation-specific penicillin-binding protein)